MVKIRKGDVIVNDRCMMAVALTSGELADWSPSEFCDTSLYSVPVMFIGGGTEDFGIGSMAIAHSGHHLRVIDNVGDDQW